MSVNNVLSYYHYIYSFVKEGVNSSKEVETLPLFSEIALTEIKVAPDRFIKELKFTGSN
jgi:hypothetical protein